MSTPTIPHPAVRPPGGNASRTGAHAAPSARSGSPLAVWRSRPGDPVRTRPAALTLLAMTALLYLWNLGSSGWANSYYAAAVQAGVRNWKAFFFGSLDAGNVITVDKTPASLWVMELSGRIFGFSSWSMLAPQALEGVAAVGLLYLAVRRVSGPAAGLVAGAALALTPVAALMSRFNNPDALLVLLLVAAGYCTVRAMEVAERKAGTRWLILAGACIGFGFLTKMLQAFLVLPALAIAFLLFAAGPLVRRIGQLLAAGAALVVSAGWWIAVVQLWSASSRPYIGGSTNNSVLELALGYNGLSRILGNSGGGPGGGAGGPGGGVGGPGGPGGGQNSGFGGATGILRMFGNAFGTEISWLLPAALIALALGLWATRRAPRTDATRASLVLWGLWAAVTALVFSFMGGTVHPYYAIALAPSIAALTAIGGRELWRDRDGLVARSGLALMVAVTGVWSIVLLGRTPDWYPAIRYALIPLTVVSVLGLMLTTTRARTRLAGAVLAGSLAAGFGATGAYAVQTAALPHSGSIPASGPTSSGMGGGFGGGPGGMGGGMGEGTANSELVALLEKTTTTWSAATVGSQSGAGLELSTGTAVMNIGGFTGSDPAPTLAQFQAYAKAGQVHYFVVGGGMGGRMGGPGGDSGTGNAIQSWVAANYPAITVGNTTVYDLTSPTS
jgi:4-amino-4-deoxy-L-arabinose transferase-like glycosyltransferase